jgi:hypothetical protein
LCFGASCCFLKDPRFLCEPPFGSPGNRPSASVSDSFVVRRPSPTDFADLGLLVMMKRVNTVIKTRRVPYHRRNASSEKGNPRDSGGSKNHVSRYIRTNEISYVDADHRARTSFPANLYTATTPASCCDNVKAGHRILISPSYWIISVQARGPTGITNGSTTQATRLMENVV